MYPLIIAIASHDLVARLIEDNQDIWQQLLHNPFVEAMRTESPSNETVTEGYKWYEVVSSDTYLPYYGLKSRPSP